MRDLGAERASASVVLERISALEGREMKAFRELWDFWRVRERWADLRADIFVGCERV